MHLGNHELPDVGRDLVALAGDPYRASTNAFAFLENQNSSEYFKILGWRLQVRALRFNIRCRYRKSFITMNCTNNLTSGLLITNGLQELEGTIHILLD